MEASFLSMPIGKMVVRVVVVEPEFSVILRIQHQMQVMVIREELRVEEMERAFHLQITIIQSLVLEPGKVWVVQFLVQPLLAFRVVNVELMKAVEVVQVIPMACQDPDLMAGMVK